MLSIIIPSRCDEFLQKTIDDLLLKAEGEVEIIIVLDGYWPDPMIKEDPRVRVVHHGTQQNSYGMRDSIDKGMALAKGKYVMKIDEHCMVDQGYDLKLAADCEDNWVVIPRRYRLDAQNWEIIKDRRPPIDYMFVSYPYQRYHDRTCGLHGEEWKRPERADILIDDTPTCQGSCYFTTREWWYKAIGPMNSEDYGQFTHEAQEVTLNTWFMGGRVIVNKKTWYAHMHKGKTGKKYGFSNLQYKKHQEGREKGRVFCRDYWLNNKFPKRIYDWEWFIEKFKPVPGWSETWKEDLIRDKKIEESNEK
jgi:glycosyltransferase involved in cell wall biosynthesis